MGTTLINFTSLVWMFVWACFPTFVISWYAQWSFDHCLHHHLSKITSFFKQWPTWRWLDFVTTFQNNLAVTKQQIVKKYFHQSWNINCPILFNTISFYTEMISISLFLGFHIELNILGTRDISCVLHEIQIWNTNLQVNLTGIKRQCPNFITDRVLLLSATSTTKVHHRLWIVMQLQ